MLYMEIHAILFNKNKYDTIKARSMLKKHDFIPIKRVKITDKYYRYTLTHANADKYNYITKIINDNVTIVFQILKI